MFSQYIGINHLKHQNYKDEHTERNTQTIYTKTEF